MFTRYPNIIDFSWGFQSYLSAGTCSKARLERSTSRSISADKKSLNLTPNSYGNDLPFILPLRLIRMKHRTDQGACKPSVKGPPGPAGSATEVQASASPLPDPFR